MSNNRSIIHVDMNAYFASVEQQYNPFLRGKPVLVCGEGRSIVTTSSYEARKYGVKTGMSPAEAMRLCPHAIRVVGDMEKYIDTTKRIRDILVEFTNRVEFFSIDEAFMDITACGSDPVEIANRVKEAVKERIGITCSVGLAPNKLLAKLGSDMKKPDGLTVIRREDVEALFKDMPVEDLCGVGRKLCKALNRLGINTAGELGQASLDRLRRYFGFWGHILHRMGRGEDNSPVAMYYDDDFVKSVGHSYTLPENTFDLAVVKSYLLMLAEKTGARMRKYNMRGRTVSLVIRYADFYTFSRQQSSEHYIFTGRDIYERACGIFEKFLPLKKAVRLLGISVSNLMADDGQGLLLDTYVRQESMARIVDGINRKYGSFTVKPASLIIAERFGILPAPGIPPGKAVSRGKLKG